MLWATGFHNRHGSHHPIVWEANRVQLAVVFYATQSGLQGLLKTWDPAGIESLADHAGGHAFVGDHVHQNAISTDEIHLAEIIAGHVDLEVPQDQDRSRFGGQIVVQLAQFQRKSVHARRRLSQEILGEREIVGLQIGKEFGRRRIGA